MSSLDAHTGYWKARFRGTITVETFIAFLQETFSPPESYCPKDKLATVNYLGVQNDQNYLLSIFPNVGQEIFQQLFTVRYYHNRYFLWTCDALSEQYCQIFTTFSFLVYGWRHLYRHKQFFRDFHVCQSTKFSSKRTTQRIIKSKYCLREGETRLAFLLYSGEWLMA